MCAIYDAIPGLEREAKFALKTFNETILLHAAAARVPVVDLRLVCSQAEDYSSLSPIEPSHIGGAKIAGALATMWRDHDFSRRSCAIYW